MNPPVQQSIHHGRHWYAGHKRPSRLCASFIFSRFTPANLNLKRGSKIKNLPASNPPNSLNISLKKSISAKSTSPSSVLGLLKRLPSLSKWRMILLWSMSLGCLKIVTILYVSNIPPSVVVCNELLLMMDLLVGGLDSRSEEDASLPRRVYGQVRCCRIHGRSLETASFGAKDGGRCSCRGMSFCLLSSSTERN